MAQRLDPGSTRQDAAGLGRHAFELQGAKDARGVVVPAQPPPRSFSATAERLLLDGDFARAREILMQAVEVDPSNLMSWVNLAAACNGLCRADDEKAALEKVLALEPRNLRALLQMAVLYEKKGEARAAAATYRTALQSVPRGVQLPPGMQAHLQHAQRAVDANSRALETFLQDRLGDLRARHSDQSLTRFDKCLDTLLQKRAIYRPKPTFMYFPNLPGIEFYDREDFPWLDRIEAATPDIRAELIEVLAGGPTALEPYVSMQGKPQDAWRELNNSRRWGVFFLWKAGEACLDNMARCPKTVAALEDWPRCDLPGSGPTAVFSILDAKTRIPPHSGVNNARLIVHVPLIVPPGCGFRVGAETRGWEPGQAFVFDDTFEHEAWNDSDVPRAVLILDVWNPYVRPAEREMVAALTAGVGEFYGELPAYM
jgi:aspartate beta-hydroxylase